MYYIGICDDMEYIREKIREFCTAYFDEHPQEYQCIEFETGTELLEYEDTIDLLFLDIELGDMNGIEILPQLEETDNVSRVIFVSSHEDMVFRSFGIKTLSFIRKPVKYEEVEKWITIALNENMKNIIYEYYVQQERRVFKMEDLYYLEGAGSYTYLNLKRKRELVSERLKCWEMKLQNAPMVRVHKSYLVNMFNIKRWEGDRVILENGAELAVGRQYRKKAQSIFRDYAKKWVKGRI